MIANKTRLLCGDIAVCEQRTLLHHNFPLMQCSCDTKNKAISALRLVVLKLDFRHIPLCLKFCVFYNSCFKFILTCCGCVFIVMAVYNRKQLSGNYMIVHVVKCIRNCMPLLNHSGFSNNKLHWVCHELYGLADGAQMCLTDAVRDCRVTFFFFL